MYKLMLILIISFAFIFAAMQIQAGIKDTKHNLSSSGPGTIKATTETQICVFCHTPHAASTAGPLWNHSLSTYNYTVSDPPGLLGSQLSTPVTGGSRVDYGSKLCLSCHDGTVALGLLYNKPGSGLGSGAVTGLDIKMPGIPGAAGSPNLGTNISSTHLVSIEYNQYLVDDKNASASDFRWKSPSDPSWTAAGNKIKLRPTGATYKGPPNTGKGVQCASCHDPHSSTYPMFMVVDYRANNANLCEFCHY